MEKSRTLVLEQQCAAPPSAPRVKLIFGLSRARQGRPQRATAPDFPACAGVPKGTKEIIYLIPNDFQFPGLTPECCRTFEVSDRRGLPTRRDSGGWVGVAPVIEHLAVVVVAQAAAESGPATSL